MRKMLVTLLVLLTGTLSSAYIRTGRGTKSVEMSGVLMNTNVLTEFPNVFSYVRCVDLCFQNEACVSVFYRRQQRRCQLHDVLFMSRQDGEEEAGTVYYIVRTDDCPSGYVHNRLLNFCYQLHLDRLDYDDAVANCTSRGDHLVVIDGVEKQNHVAKQIKSSSDTKKSKYVIDGSDAAKEGQWVFRDGRNMTCFFWVPGHPESSTNKNHILLEKSSDFLWVDRKGADICYICERDVSRGVNHLIA